MTTYKQLQAKITRRQAKIAETETTLEPINAEVKALSAKYRESRDWYTRQQLKFAQQEQARLVRALNKLYGDVRAIQAEMSALTWRVYFIAETKACYVIDRDLAGGVALLDRYATQDEALACAKRHNLTPRRWHPDDNEKFFDVFTKTPNIYEV